MSREVSAALVAGLALAAAALALALRLGGSSERGESPFAPVAAGPTDLGEAVVVGKAATGGRSIFGMRFRSQTYSAAVQLLAEAGCDLVVDGVIRGPPRVKSARATCPSRERSSGWVRRPRANRS